MNGKILVSHFNGMWLYIEKAVLSEEKIYYNILAKYNYSEALYSFDAERVSGKFPKKQEALVRAWIYMREEEIRAVLRVWQEDNEVLTIDGLK